VKPVVCDGAAAAGTAMSTGNEVVLYAGTAAMVIMHRRHIVVERRTCSCAWAVYRYVKEAETAGSAEETPFKLAPPRAGNPEP